MKKGSTKEHTGIVGTATTTENYASEIFSDFPLRLSLVKTIVEIARDMLVDADEITSLLCLDLVETVDDILSKVSEDEGNPTLGIANKLAAEMIATDPMYSRLNERLSHRTRRKNARKAKKERKNRKVSWEQQIRHQTHSVAQEEHPVA